MKLRKIFETSTLTKLSLVFTLMGVFPTSIDVFMNPTIEKLIYGMLNGSMAMFPLLKRDNLVVPSWQKYLLLSSFSLMIFIHILEFTITVPARYPDLFPVINAVLSFGHFGLFYMYFTYRQFTLSKDHKKKD
ncbi:hypothetical protein HK098_000153 [Nowakowskiella sp. JEL0407]|nr:hypothetical protein HK098_000153 [Nowakowskiella sp. JEL0407]